MTVAGRGLSVARTAAHRARGELLEEWGTRKNLQRSAGLLHGSDPPIGYMGFAARGNLGDDAIMWAHARALAPARLGMLPLESETAVYTAFRSARRRELFSGVLLGGGTVVGREPWRRRIERALRVTSGPLVVTGAGVEDPDFEGRRTYTDADELGRWAELLEGAAHVTVRGPRSAELLRRVGIEAAVVSDPALMLAGDISAGGGTRSRLVGVSVADPEDQYAGTADLVERASVEAIRTLLGSGWRIPPSRVRPQG